MTPRELLEEASEVEHAADLLPELPAGAAARATTLVQLLRDADLADAPPKALWNLLWLAAELTAHVDIYRAEALLQASVVLYLKQLVNAEPRSPLADVALAGVALFFERDDQPLCALRKDACHDALARIATARDPAVQQAAAAARERLRT